MWGIARVPNLVRHITSLIKISQFTGLMEDLLTTLRIKSWHKFWTMDSVNLILSKVGGVRGFDWII